jgi:protein ImuA
MGPLPVSAEEIHPSLWRASQLARGRLRTVDTGYPALSAELPGGGWPVGGLVDLLVENSGIGEMRLLRPALNAIGDRSIALVEPPHTPNAQGLQHIGVSPNRVLLARSSTLTDTLWCVEQILRAGCFGALVVWLSHVQASSLRRLHLAAQSSETLFVMVRPVYAARDASPATLRLSVRPSCDGLMVDIVKRRGPVLTEALPIALQPTPVLLSQRGQTVRSLHRVQIAKLTEELAAPLQQ